MPIIASNPSWNIVSYFSTVPNFYPLTRISHPDAPSLTSSSTKVPDKDPDPNLIFAVCEVF